MRFILDNIDTGQQAMKETVPFQKGSPAVIQQLTVTSQKRQQIQDLEERVRIHLVFEVDISIDNSLCCHKPLHEPIRRLGSRGFKLLNTTEQRHAYRHATHQPSTIQGQKQALWTKTLSYATARPSLLGFAGA